MKRPTWKSPQQVVNTLIEIVAKGGNLVLGVGPTPEGLIQPEAVSRLEEIGAWLKQNGKAIYNTVTTPHYNEGNMWFTASKDGKKMYAILMQKPDAPSAAQTVTWHGNVPKGSVRCLATGKKARCKVKGDEVTLTLPAGLKDQSVAFEFSR